MPPSNPYPRAAKPRARASGNECKGNCALSLLLQPLSLLVRKHNSQVMELEKKTLKDLIPEDEVTCESRWVHVFDTFDPEDELRVAQVCSRPWCSNCEPVRVWRLQRKIMKYLDYHETQFKHLWMVTRSVRNTPEVVSAFNSLRAAQRAFTKSASGDRGKDHPLRLARFWIATTEIKYSHRTGYNVHEHMIWGVNQSWRPLTAFHKYWDRAAGFTGAHINVVKLEDSRHAANYVAKYLSKGVWGGLSSGRAYLLRNALKGKNRIQTKRGTIMSKPITKYQYCCSSITTAECSNEYVMGTSKVLFDDAE